MLKDFQRDMQIMSLNLRANIQTDFGREDVAGKLRHKANNLINISQKKLPLPEEILGYSLHIQQKEWLISWETLSSKVLLILASRKYGKSDIFCIYDIVCKIYKNPKVKIGLGTREQSKAVGIMTAVSYWLKFYGVLKKHDIVNSKSIHIDKSSKQATLKSLSPDALGLKGNHLDYLYLDDIVGAKDEYSDKRKDSVEKFYQECLNVCSGKIIILGQPVSNDDLYNYLEKTVKVPTIKAPHGIIPQLDKSIEELTSSGATKKNIFKNYFMQIIADEQNPLYHFNYQGFTFDKSQYVYACIDPATTGSDGVGLAMGYIYNDTFYIYGELIKHNDKNINIYSHLSLIADILNQYNVAELSIEINKDLGLLKTFQDMPSLFKVSIKGHFESIEKKSARITNRFSSVKDKLIISGDIAIIKNYDINQDKDDLPDAIASLINLMNGNPDRIKVYRNIYDKRV